MTELGTKHECAGCGIKFYDLGNPEALCPKCGWDPKQEEPPKKPKPIKKKKRKAAKKVEKPAPEPESDDKTEAKAKD